MPRRRQTGLSQNRTDLNQAPKAAVGLPYGQHSELIDAQKKIPLPQTPPVQAPGNAAGGSATPSPVGGANPLDQAMAEAQATSFQPVGLTSPTSRPLEPVTAGLDGPVIARPSRVSIANTLSLLAQSGDPELARLADKARIQGV